MEFKKTFWMNVFFTIAWMLLCLLSFATDIDYVEHTLTYKIFTAFIQLFILTIPITTAIYMYKSNNLLLRKFALFGNYLSAIGILVCILAIIFYQLSKIFSMDFLIVLFVYCIFAAPFLINLKALRS